MSSMTDVENVRSDGLATGFRELNKKTSGLHDGIWSSWRVVLPWEDRAAMNIVENVASRPHLPVGVFALEMSGQELITRMLCSRLR